MMETLKAMATNPNCKQEEQKTTLSKRLLARIRYNFVTKKISELKAAPRGPTVVDIGGFLTKTRTWTLLWTAALLGLGFYSSVLVTATRKETFTKNAAVIEQNFGRKHREAFGEDTKLSRYGYPDMGNNIYADLLPYRDWVTINNVQRMHESGYEQTFIFLPNAFICALSFPRTVAWLTASFTMARYNHINSYTSFRGANNALIHEAMMHMSLIFVIAGAFASSVRITGVLNPLVRRLSPAMASLKNKVWRTK